MLPPSQQGTETSFHQVKTPCSAFSVVRKYPRVSFSQTSIIRKAAFPQTETLGIAKCKGVSHCLAPTQPAQASGKERAFPSPDVSNKGQRKTQPWWDPALSLSSGNVNRSTQLLRWECRSSCHINQTRLRDQKLQQNQMAAYGADNASVNCACSQSFCLSSRRGDGGKTVSACSLPQLLLSVATERLRQGKNSTWQLTRGVSAEG